MADKDCQTLGIHAEPKANNMNQQLFINGQAKFPVSTEALDFIQNQIFLTARLCSLAGQNVIITPATTTTDGLVVINGELLPLLAGTAKQYIQLVETKQTIVAGTQTFTDVRIIRHAQYANSGTPVSQFTTIDNIVRLMQRISAVEGTYMTETDIRSLVQSVRTALTTTNSNLSSLTTRVQTVENNYKTAAEITELLNANAQHHLPKGSIIDWYGTADFENIPYGYVPCGSFFAGSASQFAPDGAGTQEIAKWKTRYSAIQIGTIGLNNGSKVGIRIYDCNSQTVPDLTDRFIVQAGGNYSLGNTGGDNEVTLVEKNMPRHKHDVVINNTNSAHQHRVAWPANAGGDATITANNYIDQGGQGAHGNETYIVTHATAAGYDGKHTHTVSESYKGNGTAFSIMPPYFALYKLIKVI